MQRRYLALVLPLLLLGALASAAPARPDVRRLNDGNQRLRVEASTSGKTLDALEKGQPFLVLETLKSRASLDGKTGPWLKVRDAKGQEGFLLSPFLDKASGAFFASADFPETTFYSDYLLLALRRGERVKATETYERVEAGEEGYFVSWGEEEPNFLIVWDSDLSATPLDSAIDKDIPRVLEDRIYFVYANILAPTGAAETADFPAMGLDWAVSRADEFVEGASVSLGAHLIVDPKDADSINWNDEMESYVGKVATITEVAGFDDWDRPIVYVDIDDGEWQWRVENMRLEAGSEEDYSAGDEYYSSQDEADQGEESYGMIAEGSMVVLGTHDAVDEDTNWNEDMAQYVGLTAKVTALDGSDEANCLGVRVDGNSYFWRIRNLTVVGRGDEGSYGFQVGDRVILGRHRAINGDANWSEDMAEYVGEEATITELLGFEEGDAHCFLASVDVDSGEWVWRVENMTPAP